MSYLGIKAIVIIVTMVAAGAGAVANAMWGPKAQARRRLDAVEKATIADRELVTLTGTVRAAGATLDAPLSGKPCVLYEVTGRVYDSADSGRRQPPLRAQIADAKMVAFELETVHGVVHVEGEHADTELPHAPVIPRKIDRERALLEAHDVATDTLRTASFEEAAVEIGARVRVQGMAIVESAPTAHAERGFRDEAPKRIRLVAPPDRPLTIGRARK